VFEVAPDAVLTKVDKTPKNRYLKIFIYLNVTKNVTKNLCKGMYPSNIKWILFSGDV